jgi:hypothetical protein
MDVAPSHIADWLARLGSDVHDFGCAKVSYPIVFAL